MEKRGFSHIEIILAFMIFISATVFVFYFFNPMEKNYITDYTLEGIYGNMENEISVNIYSYGIKINRDIIKTAEPAANDKVISIQLNNARTPNEYPIAKKIDGGFIETNIKDNDKVCFEVNGLQAQGQGQGLLNFLFVNMVNDSKLSNFQKLSDACPDAVNTYYTLASYDESKVITLEKIKLFETEYNQNYYTLKDTLGLSSSDNFEFSIIFENQNMQSNNIKINKNLPSGITVNSINKRVNVLMDEGNIAGKLEPANINIRIW